MGGHKSHVMTDGSAKSGVAYGLTIVGGVMLCMVGVFQILEGIVGLAKDDIYVSGLNYAYRLDLSTWGAIHLVIGLVALAAGIGIVLGEFWAYLLGIAIAALSALSNFAFIPIYPLWSVTVIAFDVLVIWALCHQIRARP